MRGDFHTVWASVRACASILMLPSGLLGDASSVLWGGKGTIGLYTPRVIHGSAFR